MSSKLENLNVACNQLGQDGGKILLEGVKMSKAIKRVRWTKIHNYISKFSGIMQFHLSRNAKIIMKTLFQVDVRLTGCGRDVDLSIQEILRKNKSMGVGHKGTTWFVD